jgi:hypothetical protein
VVSVLWPQVPAFALCFDANSRKIGCTGLLPHHRHRALACDRAVCLPQNVPYHTLSRPRNSEPLPCTVRNAGSGTVPKYRVRYGTSGHRSNSRRSGSSGSAQVRRGLPSTRRSFDLCNAGTLSLGLQDTWTPSSSNSTGRSASSCLGNLGCWDAASTV